MNLEKERERERDQKRNRERKKEEGWVAKAKQFTGKPGFLG